MNTTDASSRTPWRLVLLGLAALLAVVLGAGVAVASQGSDSTDRGETAEHPGPELPDGDLPQPVHPDGGPPADAVDIPLDELPPGSVLDH